MYKDYTYIVTGCTGFVGNVLTKKLLNDGCNVIGFARSEKKANVIFKELKPQFIFGDISNREDVERLFQNADENTVVIHTVAKVSIGESALDTLYTVTVDGTKNVVDACVNKKVKKLLHISSTEAIPKDIEIKEDLSNYIPEPEKVRKGYPRTKSIADKLVLDAVKNNSLNASILLLACVLGAGDYGVGHMSQLFIDYMTGKLPASINGGYNTFDIRDVADVLPAIVENSKKGESYIFARNTDRINDLLDVISEKQGIKKLVTLPMWLAYVGLPFLSLGCKIAKKRPLYTSQALASLKGGEFPISKAVKEFGYTPRTLKETVCDHVDFLLNEGLVK